MIETMTTYQYRVIKSSWGIAIDIGGEIVFATEAPFGAARVLDGIYVSVGPSWVDDCQRRAIADGVKQMASSVRAACPRGEVATARILDVSYNPCDYQAEAVPWAVAGWIAEALQAPPPEVSVEFDAKRNRYF